MHLCRRRARMKEQGNALHALPQLATSFASSRGPRGQHLKMSLAIAFVAAAFAAAAASFRRTRRAEDEVDERAYFAPRPGALTICAPP